MSEMGNPASYRACLSSSANAGDQVKQEDPALQARIAELQELRKANGLYYKP